MSKVHFITYGSDHRWIYALDRIEREARKCGVFDSVTCYTPAMLDRDFAKRYAAVLKQTGGGGYWIWKPQIIRQKLDESEPGDAVVYADAGCRLEPRNEAQLFQLINKLNRTPPLANYGMLSVFRGDYGDRYMTNQVINYFKRTYGMDDGYKREFGLEAGALIFLKNDHAYKILDEFEKLLRTDMMLITDAYNHLPQHPNFSGESRRDQVIFSLLAREFGCVKLNRGYSEQDFICPVRLRRRASVRMLFRAHGALAPFYLVNYLVGNSYRCLADALTYIKEHRRRAPRRLARDYRRNRRLQQGFYMQTKFSLMYFARVAAHKIKRGGG